MQSKNRLGDKGIKEIAEGMKHNNSVKELDLVRYFFLLFFFLLWCEIRQCGVTFVMQSSNRVGDEGAMVIAENLRFNSCLKELDLVSLSCSVTLYFVVYCCCHLRHCSSFVIFLSFICFF
jgi:hypothetical protein